jgi:hypothetical protein
MIPRRILPALALALLVPCAAYADYMTDFEGLNGSPAGVPLTGQDGFYIPGGTDSVDYNVHTYAGNSLGFPANPEGGDQFVAGTGPASPTFARAQRDFAWADRDVWTVTYDFAGNFQGSGAAAQNLGSLSTQPSATSNGYIHLMTWVDINNPTNFNAFFLAFDAGGVQFAQPGASPGPEWENLEVNHWYRSQTVLDFATNQILEVSILDLETQQGATFNPTDWFLGGRADDPDSFRFFAGGGVAGNTLAFDNFSIVPEPATAFLLLAGGFLALRRRK